MAKSSLTGTVLIVLSTLTLFHAAFSTYEHFAQLKALGRSEGGIRQVPSDIVAESFVALLAFIIGVTLNAPPLKEITWSSEMRKRTIDEMNSRLNFAGFNHKGRLFLNANQASE